MRAYIMPAIVAASLSLAPVAFAATAHSATGAIKAYDAKTHSITLSNGTTYMLPANFKADGLKAGARVEVSWVMKGKNHDATAVKLLK